MVGEEEGRVGGGNSHVAFRRSLSRRDLICMNHPEPPRAPQMAWMSFQLTADDLESQLAGLACAVDAVLCRLPE